MFLNQPTYPTHPLMHPKHLQEILGPGREEELVREGKVEGLCGLRVVMELMRADL